MRVTELIRALETVVAEVGDGDVVVECGDEAGAVQVDPMTAVRLTVVTAGVRKLVLDGRVAWCGMVPAGTRP